MNIISKFKIFILKKLFQKDLIIMNCNFHGEVHINNNNPMNPDTIYNSFIIGSTFIGGEGRTFTIDQQHGKINNPINFNNLKKRKNKKHTHKFKFISKRK
jgi:hypothetical protein